MYNLIVIHYQNIEHGFRVFSENIEHLTFQFCEFSAFLPFFFQSLSINCIHTYNCWKKKEIHKYDVDDNRNSCGNSMNRSP